MLEAFFGANISRNHHGASWRLLSHFYIYMGDGAETAILAFLEENAPKHIKKNPQKIVLTHKMR